MTDDRGLLDRFTRIDTKVGAISDQISIIKSQIQTQTDVLQAVADELGADAGDVRGREYPWDASAVIPQDTGRLDPLVNDVQIEYDARITEVIVGFPSGAGQLAGVQVGQPGGDIWVPRGGKSNTSIEDPEFEQSEYIGLNDTVVRFEVNEVVGEDDPIRVKYVNNDTEHEHFVNVLIKAEEVV